MAHQRFDHSHEDELLERLYSLQEEGNTVACGDAESRYPGDDFEPTLEEARKGGLVTVAEGTLALTPEGKRRAAGIVRRHRLAERLVTDVLGMTPEDSEKSACEFEHLVAPEIADSICILLGHPRSCPHGLPIPEGDCCKAAKTQVEASVASLTDIAPGQEVRVAYLNAADQRRMGRLMQMGITPGAILRLRQAKPAVVVDTTETQIAMEPDVARDIYVWRPAAG